MGRKGQCSFMCLSNSEWTSDGETKLVRQSAILVKLLKLFATTSYRDIIGENAFYLTYIYYVF